MGEHTNTTVKIVAAHLTASRFYGGPERQMVELARELAPDVRSSFVSFAEKGLCEDFLSQVSRAGFKGASLINDTPRLVAAGRELHQRLAEMQANVLCVHGYKASVLGIVVGRKLQLPVVAVSRGWTAENRKVRLYERLEKLILRRMDRVVCVSHGQARKVLDASVPRDKICVIHNAIRTERFNRCPDPEFRKRLEALFGANPPQFIVGAAGRLSREKGFDSLVGAGDLMRRNGNVDSGIVLFGDGTLRDELQRLIDGTGLGSRFILAGFTAELDSYMPHFDAFVQASHTEGLPNVLLEAAAAGVPVVATNVGGTGEVVIDGKTGLLVPPSDAVALAGRLTRLLLEQKLRASFQQSAKQHVHDKFTFAAQADAYKRLFESLLPPEQVA